MKPKILKTRFGSITLRQGKEAVEFDHDVLIRLDGTVSKRKKKLSKEVYGTSHVISLAEAEHCYEPGAEMLLIGSGQVGLVSLSDEAAQFLDQRGVEVVLEPTPAAMDTWNELKGQVIGLFHVTC